ncbi:MAG: protein kinase [Kiritimatiellae bacterium]|nr:protein kinase [Kiritimatiellia bacterium]
MNIPGFEMIEKLGQGGMAAVWKARQVSLDRIVAIKILSANLTGDQEDVKRFQTEAQSAAKLKHPGIIQVYDANAEDGSYYFVMEYVAGYTVGDWLRRKGVIPEKDALLVVQCVADAMGYAWEKERIIHCDLKPDNIIIDSDGAVKVADLGLARTISSISNDDVSDEVLGTPAYLSPEQASGRQDLDCRADIYSLGAMLYHLVTGKMLFEGHTEEEVMDLQITGTVKDPMEINSAISPSLCWLIEKMLVKDKDGRYQDWNAILLDLGKVKKKLPIAGRPPEGASTVERSPKRTISKRVKERSNTDSTESTQQVHASKGMPVPAKIGIVVALVAVVFLVIMLLSKNSSSPPPPKPRRIQEPSVVRIPKEPDAEESYGSVARRGYEEAVKWADENPDSYDESIRKFNRIVVTARGTRYAVKAEARIRELSRRREETIRDVMGHLKRSTDFLVKEGKYSDAIRVYSEYNGELADTTRLRRAAIVARLQDGQKKIDEDAKKREEICAGKMEDLLGDVIKTLVNDGISSALTVVDAAVSDPHIASMTVEVGEIKDALNAANNVDMVILESFNAQKGKSIVVDLLTGKKTLKILSARDDRIKALRRVRGATVKASFAIKDLTMGERMRRMGNDDLPEVALVKGLMAIRSRAFSHARKYLEKTFPVFSAKLLAYLDLEENALSKEDHDTPAGLAAPVIVRAEPNNVHEEPVPIVKKQLKPAVSVDVVRKQLCAINPELQEREIQLFADENGVVYKASLVSPAVRKINPLAGLTRLRDVSVEGYPSALSDLTAISALEGLPLESLSVAFSSVKNLAALKGMALKNLNISHTPVMDIAVLRNIPLKQINAAHTKIKHLQNLKGMSLESLNINGTKVADIKATKGMPLRNLSFAHTLVKDISSLKGMPLEHLNMSHSKVFDISALKRLPLLSLDVSSTSVKDISSLKGMPLARLNLNGTRVTDISALKEMNLTSLALSETMIKDFSVIAGMPLIRLELRSTKVRDLLFLAGMPLKNLDMSDTGVDQLAILRGMDLRRLNIKNTRVADLEPIKDMQLVFLDCRGLRSGALSALAGSSIVNINVDQADTKSVIAVLRTMPELRTVNGRPWNRWAGDEGRRPGRPNRRGRDNRR